IPLARRTGGLADTIKDYEPLKSYGTGFLFDEYNASSFRECVKRALCVCVDRRRWKKVVVSAMKEDFSWKVSAMEYSKLYETAVERKRGMKGV
ncbi:MAG TPA: starch synthase, partial [Thermodesulfovibrionales bacterium]|nr:starch synthase [Thermodesulfovibrionales bacterium]